MIDRAMQSAQDVFLLFIRCYWGWQFFQSGFGKIKDMSGPIAYFAKLNIPMSEFAAYCDAGILLVGGPLLIVGFCARPVASALSLLMLGAYYFADTEALFSIFKDPDQFIAATPFSFLFAALIVWMFGAGRASVDGLIMYLARR